MATKLRKSTSLKSFDLEEAVRQKGYGFQIEFEGVIESSEHHAKDTIVSNVCFWSNIPQFDLEQLAYKAPTQMGNLSRVHCKVLSVWDRPSVQYIVINTWKKELR